MPFSVIARTDRFRYHQRILKPRASQDDDSVEAMFLFIYALVDYAWQEFQSLVYTYPTMRMHVVIEFIGELRIVQRTTNNYFRVSRSYSTRTAIMNDLPGAIMDTLERLGNSGIVIELDDLLFHLTYIDPSLEVQGRMPKRVQKAIRKPVEGVVDFATDCAFTCVLYLLVTSTEFRSRWTGDFTWFTQEFENLRVIRWAAMSKKRLVLLLGRLKQSLGFDTWSMSTGAGSGHEKFLTRQPKYQVIIVNEYSRGIYDHRRGTEHTEYVKGATLMLNYVFGHVSLIHVPWKYFGYARETTFRYCCQTFGSLAQHRCAAQTHCDRCLLVTRDLETHKQGTELECTACSKPFYSEHCFEHHKCTWKNKERCDICMRAKGDDHDCSKYRCLFCSEYVEYGHCCYIKKCDGPERVEPETHGKNYYAFDFESTLSECEDGSHLHKVNFVAVIRCFTRQKWTFRTLDEFHRWLVGLTEESVFFAHNLKGYDGRLMFEYMFDNNKLPTHIVWRGAKIMTMTYGLVKFQDTLLHLQTSLEEMPAMFGLDPARFKKGFFPYRFNTDANQTYIGEIPAIEYFDIENMKPRKRLEFLRWYSEQRGPYNFREELEAYCVSDTLILAESIEAYMNRQMADFALNPWSSMTIASYAMKMYRTYFLPENTIAILRKSYEDMLRPGMHGGRTDTRKLLREFSESELNAGIYAKYQDVQSLYPTVQFYDPMPTGPPKVTFYNGPEQPTLEHLRSMFGFVKCDIWPTRYLHHPIIVELSEETGLLCADLERKNDIVIATPELHLALQNGYEVSNVSWTMEFQPSTECFKDYFRSFIKTKLEASGVPSYVRTPEDWTEFQRYHSEELGIELDRNDMQRNPARKIGAKLLCNSLWGKFGERNHKNKFASFQDSTESRINFESKWADGDIDINYYRRSSNGQASCIAYTENEPDVPWSVSRRSEKIFTRIARSKRSVAIASMVTSHARVRLWTELNKLGDRVMYHDTDSIIYEHRADAYNIPEGRYLGEWEDECGGRPITAFVSTGPKCYSYKIRNTDGSIEVSTKIKGITLNSHNNNLINYDSMRDLAIGNTEKIQAKVLRFRYDRTTGEMSTLDMLKDFRKTYAKGDIMPDYSVKPFGWQNFSQSV